MKSVYKCRHCDDVCYATNLKDIFKFISRILKKHDSDCGFFDFSIQLYSKR